MLNTLMIIVVGIGVAGGLGVAIWSYFDTRKKHYDEYKERKSRD